MNIDQNQYEQQEPPKCTSCKNFYASEQYKGLCSSCFKKVSISETPIQSQKKQELNVKIGDTQKAADFKAEAVPKLEEQKQEPKKQEEKPKQVDRKRCFTCRKKVGLLGVECKCSFVFCNAHRLPEEHECAFNHQEAGKDKLKQDLVKVCHDKISEI